MRKIGILSDIHSNYIALEEILNKLRKENIDEYVFCGDYITDGFKDNDVLEAIRSINSNIVAGNREVSVATYDGSSWKDLNQFKSMQYSYDNITKENLEFLRSLPIFKVITLAEKKVYFSHGSHKNVREAIWEDSYNIFDTLINKYNADIYITGHTHMPFCKRYKGKLFINAGSAGSPVNGNPASIYGILEIDGDNISFSHRVFNYDYNMLKKEYLNSEYHKKCIEWSNLLIYTFRDAFDYHCDFIQYINKTTNGDLKQNSKLWNEKLIQYCKMKNLDILE